MGFSHCRNSFTVSFHKGTERCLRPLPRMRAQPPLSNCRSPIRRAVISETRAPVLYINSNKTRSRNPVGVDESGDSNSVCICSRLRYPTSRRSNRFAGIARRRCATGNSRGSWNAAYRMNERIAASRALRLRGQFPRFRSKSSKKARIRDGSKSGTDKASAFLR